MQFDSLLKRQSVCIANLSEVGAILSAVTDGDFPMPRLGQNDFVQAVKIWTKTGLDFIVTKFERIELD